MCGGGAEATSEGNWHKSKLHNFPGRCTRRLFLKNCKITANRARKGHAEEYEPEYDILNRLMVVERRVALACIVCS